MPTTTALKTPKYVLLADELRGQIEQGILRPGDRMPTFVEIRDRHGVTAATVNRIYTHLENDGLIVREPGRGTFVKRRDERPATGVIGIRGLAFSQHPYFLQLIGGFQDVASRAGVELLLLNDEVEIKREKVDGVLFCDTNFSRYEQWRQLPSDIPCVTTIVNARDYISVVGDEYQGAYDLTRHLLELGHRRIGYMYDPFPPRLAGYKSALQDAGIEVEEQCMRTVAFQSDPDPGYSAPGYKVMKAWLQDGWSEAGCSALMTQNDDAAIGAIRALSEAGLSVPGDISVAGFDGTGESLFGLPRLTTVRVPLREIGSTALELLLRQIGGEAAQASTVVLPTRLLEGESVAKIEL